MNWGPSLGFRSGYLSAHEAVWRLKMKGYRWIALEYNDFDNEVHAPAYRTACRDLGIVFTIWMRRPFTAHQARQAVIESGAAGFIAEGEIPGHRPEAQNWSELVHALQDLTIPNTRERLPCAVVTNFAPFVHRDGSPWPEKAKPLVEAGWACLTECYDLDGDPKMWIPARHEFAQHFTHTRNPDVFSQGKGWYETQPVIGLYDGRTWSDFPQFDRFRNGSVWSAEYVI